jgi:hypothetical protein
MTSCDFIVCKHDGRDSYLQWGHFPNGSFFVRSWIAELRVTCPLPIIAPSACLRRQASISCPCVRDQPPGDGLLPSRGPGRGRFAGPLRGFASSREPIFGSRIAVGGLALSPSGGRVWEGGMRCPSPSQLRLARRAGKPSYLSPEGERAEIGDAGASGSRTPRLLAGNERVGHPASSAGLTPGLPIRCDLVHTQFSFARIAHPCIFIDEP